MTPSSSSAWASLTTWERRAAAYGLDNNMIKNDDRRGERERDAGDGEQRGQSVVRK